MRACARVVLLAISVAGVPPTASLAEDAVADVCLEVRPVVLEVGEWPALAAAMAQAIAARPALFPRPLIEDDGSRIDITADHHGRPSGAAPCLEQERDWTVRFGRAFLQAAAERMLAEAPTTPGIDSSVSIEWFPTENRLRTLLEFSGPLDVPNGRCWIDDSLTLDASAGAIVASGERGLETSPFAEGACGRFYDHLPSGGAGEQAVTLLLKEVVPGDGAVLRLVAERVTVLEDAIVISGRFEHAD